MGNAGEDSFIIFFAALGAVAFCAVTAYYVDKIWSRFVWRRRFERNKR